MIAVNVELPGISTRLFKTITVENGQVLWTTFMFKLSPFYVPRDLIYIEVTRNNL